jgi:predicted MFS family arabinose efflux permease
MLGMLAMPLLWLVALGSAALTLFFTLASVAVLPTIVQEDQLVEANAKLHMSEAVLSLAGPSSAGALIQLVTAPKAIIADVFSFVASAFSLGGIASSEPTPATHHSGIAAIRNEILEGLSELVRTPLLRALAISMGMIVVGGAMIATVNVLFLTRTLSFSPATIGMLAACTGVGTLIGAVVAAKAADVLTLGGAIVVAGFLESASLLLTPSAAIVAHPIPLLMSTGVLTGVAYSVLSINQISLRQRITPPRLLGRVTAARRFLIFCMAPLGAVAGGWMGTSVGLEATLLAGGCVTLVASIYMWLSPIRSAS